MQDLTSKQAEGIVKEVKKMANKFQGNANTAKRQGNSKKADA